MTDIDTYTYGYISICSATQQLTQIHTHTGTHFTIARKDRKEKNCISIARSRVAAAVAVAVAAAVAVARSLCQQIRPKLKGRLGGRGGAINLLAI